MGLTLLYLFYGLAFYALGIVVHTRTRPLADLPIARAFGWLAVFGLTHGTQEWVELFHQLGVDHPASRIAGTLLLCVSYTSLLQFGIELIRLSRPVPLGLRAMPSVLLAVSLYPALSGAYAGTGDAAPRLILGPASALVAGFALIYYRQRIGGTNAAATPFAFAGAFFVAYASFATVSAEADFFPASVLNTVEFARLVGLPVQLFRAACATGITYAIYRSLNIFDLAEKRRVEALIGEATRVLGETASQYRQLFELAGDAVLLVEPGSGRIILANGAASRLLGYASHTLESMTLRELLPQNAADKMHTALLDLLDSDRAPAPVLIEMDWLAGDGRHVPVEVAGNVVARENRHIVQLVARDTTERKQMLARLMRADRMASVGLLAAGVAHEINNPLCFVSANLDVLAAELPDLTAHLGADAATRSRLAELLSVVGEARVGADRVQKIVATLSTFSKVDARGRHAVRVRDVLNSAVRLTRDEIDARARLELSIDDDLAVQGTEARLAQVFVNLLQNAALAIDGRPEDGHLISVTARRARPGRVAVEVRDTGQGISPDLIDRIFEPFVTTRPLGEGAGLGLSIAHNIVQELDGEITVRSEVGVGSTFRVELPAARPAEATLPTPEPEPDDGAPRARVLVVDDEPTVCRVLRRLLGRQHEVHTLTQGSEALDVLTGDEHFDVIFCDLMMPGLNGMDLFERVRELRPDRVDRFVFMTGGAFTAKAQNFLDTTPNPRLDKPFEADQVRGVVASILAQGPVDS